MIRQFVLRNWQCFKGEHVIPFSSHAYAITSKYQSDPGRSNRGGKSAFFEAIDFVLTGRLAKHRRFNSDDWISRGADEGAVSIVLEDGTAIKREKKRGKPTQIRMSNSKGAVASQADAESAILKYLSFDEEDFKTVAYFEQRQMARIILTEPEKRLDVVRGWLNLAPAERAEERAAEITRSRVKALQSLRARREALATILSVKVAISRRRAALGEGCDTQIEDSKEEVVDEEAIRKIVSETTARLNEVRSEIASVWKRARDEQDVEEYDAKIEDGKKLATELEDFPEGLEEKATELQAGVEILAARHAAAVTTLNSKRKVSLGQFDGRCPVAELQCPVKEKINKDRSASSLALREAKAAEETAAESLRDARSSASSIMAQAKEAEWKKANLGRLRAEVLAERDEIRTKRKALKASPTPRLEMEMTKERDALENILSQASSAIANAKAKRDHREKLEQELESLNKEIKTEAFSAAVASQTRSIFRATQRRLAERALNVIGKRANDMLSRSGVDLSVDIRWEREGKGLAKTCEMCGVAFPASAKAKECESCGAERGQNIVQRLEFLPSDRSGGADDFAGIAMQLAAGSWLLGARQSPWATCLLDESLSQMDKTTRRAAAHQLLHLLGSSAYRQVFVISHSQDTLDMFPGQICVHVARDGTRRIEMT